MDRGDKPRLVCQKLVDCEKVEHLGWEALDASLCPGRVSSIGQELFLLEWHLRREGGENGEKRRVKYVEILFSQKHIESQSKQVSLCDSVESVSRADCFRAKNRLHLPQTSKIDCSISTWTEAIVDQLSYIKLPVWCGMHDPTSCHVTHTHLHYTYRTPPNTYHKRAAGMHAPLPGANKILTKIHYKIATN